MKRKIRAYALRQSDARLISQLRKLEVACFGTAFDHLYYGAILAEGPNVVLADQHRIMGYVLARTQAHAIQDKLLLEADPAFASARTDGVYVETVGIMPEYRGGASFIRLLRAFVAELRAAGVTRIAMHTRVSNRAADVVARFFAALGDVNIVREVPIWPFFEQPESVVYMEATLRPK